MGKDYGRSIAVASSRGLCILDLSRMAWSEMICSSEKSGHATDEKNSPCIRGRPCSESALNPIPLHSPRWKLFRNVRDEQRFRVVNMIWWERCSDNFKQSKGEKWEDLLVAVVQYYSIGDSTPYLVCWSRRR